MGNYDERMGMLLCEGTMYSTSPANKQKGKQAQL